MLNKKRKNKIILPNTHVGREKLTRKVLCFFALSFFMYMVTMGYNLSQVVARAKYTQNMNQLQNENTELESKYFASLSNITEEDMKLIGLSTPKNVHYAEIDTFAYLIVQ